MPVVSVSMPAELIERLDAFAEDHEYTGRSEVVRESARSLLSEFDDDRLADRRLAGIVSVLYDFGTQSVERRVTEIRHDHEDAIASNDHSHVGDPSCCGPANTITESGATPSGSSQQPGYCLDLFVLESDLEEISRFVGRLRAVDGVETVDYSLVPLDAPARI